MLELLKTISDLELTEFKMKDDNFKLTIRTKDYVKATEATPIATSTPTIVPVPQQMAPPATNIASQPPTTGSNAASDTSSKESSQGEGAKDYLEVKSPIVGTFYRSSSPEKPPYVKVGDVVNKGDVVCIVEAMKLFNEIESELSGKIVKVMVEDAQPVEYDQVLFLLEA